MRQTVASHFFLTHMLVRRNREIISMWFGLDLHSHQKYVDPSTKSGYELGGIKGFPFRTRD